ncbi:MAG: hypothetical protein BZY88_15010 [SAR202 cluster bacterium Io17-Chloro-G9]|nr:MAG: hypothetical protein BZY88_15010 [SAR202 cluster bacterium Io17-Chloro-G9]
MFVKLEHPPVSKNKYLKMASPELAAELTDLAEELRHLRFIHVNSTATGGGVAEILQSMVPLMNALGLATERVVIDGNPDFFQVTKRIHNLLQGAEGSLSASEFETYFQTNQSVADEFKRRGLEADAWFLHDPQVLPLASMLPLRPGEVRNWVCHIDLTTPNESTINSLLPLTQDYDNLFFSLPHYVPAGLNGVPVHIAPPAIDPVSSKNTSLSDRAAKTTVAAMGIDPHRPLVTQVSRFDLWKDPRGVVDAFLLARKTIPGLQLALLGLSQAIDDPEALDVLREVEEYAGADPDIHLYYDVDGLPGSIDHVVSAFQVASDVVLQKSTREGFGLTVTEAMWKGKPMIGGNVGGIRVQIEDGVNGFLVDSPEECARRIVQFMEDADLRARLGLKARESVRQRFLLPRLVLDYLRAVKSVSVPSNGNGSNNGLSLNGHSVNGLAGGDAMKGVTTQAANYRKQTAS